MTRIKLGNSHLEDGGDAERDAETAEEVYRSNFLHALLIFCFTSAAFQSTGNHYMRLEHRNKLQ